MTTDKRLSCRECLGGHEKLRAMQSDLHAQVGAKRGLERGVAGSKAKHEAVASFYSTMTAVDKALTLKPKDYAATAMGIKTESWRQAEEVAKANATMAAREPRSRKATGSKAKALQKRAGKLEQQAQDLNGKIIKLRTQQDDLERRAKSLEERERKVSAAGVKHLAAEVERAALVRRLQALEGAIAKSLSVRRAEVVSGADCA